MIKAEGVRGDWDDDDDDNWDDWGDAEDNTPYFETQTHRDTPQTTMPKTQMGLPSDGAPQKRHTEVKNGNQQNDIGKSEGLLQEDKSWGSVWRPWGGVVSSVLSTASEGLGNITSTVSQGLTNVIGVLEPEELAKLNAAEHIKKETVQSSQRFQEGGDSTRQELQSLPPTPAFGLNIVSGVTTLGTKVLNTGLDTLEGIGKKTMNILQENDPLLINKRKMLGLEVEKPNLSEILKEAKQESDHLENTLKELKLNRVEILRFDILFENNCGLVHLEALEILSTESQIKLQSLLNAVSGLALAELEDTLKEVKELMELEDLECESDGNYDENQLNAHLMSAIEDVQLQINFDDLKENWAEVLNWIDNNSDKADVQETFAKGIDNLAETCALEINKLHKIAELLLVKEHHSTADEVDSIVQLCRHFTLHLNGLANRFALVLSTEKGDDTAKAKINKLFAEMYQGAQLIEKAFKLFLPILQIGAV